MCVSSSTASVSKRNVKKFRRVACLVCVGRGQEARRSSWWNPEPYTWNPDYVVPKHPTTDRTKIPYFQHDQREWSVYRDLWRRLVAGLIFHFPQLSLHRPQVRLKFEFAKRRGWREPKKRRSYPGWIHVLVLVCAPIISTITTHSIMCLCRWLRSSDKWVQ